MHVLQRNMMESPYVAMKDAHIMQRLENTVNYIYVILIATKKERRAFAIATLPVVALLF
jgi:hypothetical protein